MIKPRFFVFVEFTDPKVRLFLDELRNTLSGAALKDSPHITVRGPYNVKPEKPSIDIWKQGLEGNGVLLIDSGIFKTSKGYAVFLHAKSKIFDDKLWWKPDYQGPKSSRKPHVTIFETKSSYCAELVRNFLNTEDISVFTYGVDLTVYTSKQHELLGYNENILEQSYKTLAQERIQYRDGLFERAHKLREHIAHQEDSPPIQTRLF